MSDGVKYIFRTIFKVPIIILVVYAIFNVFAFSLTYFRLLGFSYVVMQTAVENNYIPPEEMNTLNKYLQSITDNGVVGDAEIVISNEEDASILPADRRRQYGSPVTVGVKAQYKFIWPLTPKEQLTNTSGGFIGYGSNTGSFSGYASTSTLEARRKALEDNKNNNINITYTVIGLKYYSDLN